MIQSFYSQHVMRLKYVIKVLDRLYPFLETDWSSGKETQSFCRRSELIRVIYKQNDQT